MPKNWAPMVVELFYIAFYPLIKKVLTMIKIHVTSSFDLPGHDAPLITTNYKRVIEVWFDEKYKKSFYAREPLAK
jgi:hypothetical protein